MKIEDFLSPVRGPLNWYLMNAAGEIKPAVTWAQLNRESIDEWRSWWRIGDTEVGIFSRTARISTVFLGLDHRYDRYDGHGPPLVFETMIFGGPLDEEQARYATMDEAKEGHKQHCRATFISLVFGKRVGHWWLALKGYR